MFHIKNMHEQTHDDMGNKDTMREEEDETTVWTTRMLDKRNRKDRIDGSGLGRVEASISSKRKEDDIRGKPRKSKKLRYDVLGKDWGLTEDEGNKRFLHSGRVEISMVS